MKERPILFSAPMVRALLDGSKTQTRRVAVPKRSIEPMTDECPYGQPGDRLWVRETWAYGIHALGSKYLEQEGPWVYAADNIGSQGRLCDRWRPSIHMFRAASRITLEVTGVRVERLKDINEADAKAEGCERLDDDEPGYIQRDEPDWKLCPKCGGTRLHNALGNGGGVIFDVDCMECDTYVKRYQHLWESINGPGSWDANPWVWAVEFRRLP